MTKVVSTLPKNMLFLTTMVVQRSSTPRQSLFLFSPLFKITLFFILLVIPCTSALFFNLTNIGPDDQNIYINTHSSKPSTYSTAYISSQGIQVTSDEQHDNFPSKAGKATYVHPLHLWDNATGNLADFSTYFSFVIDSNESWKYADGLAFFLAPDGSNTSLGGGIGLPLDGVNRTSPGEPTSPFVAVEFDTYGNIWDPPKINEVVTHVGIDVNSVISNVTAVWYSNVTAGIVNEAWISYDSKSYNLSVVVTGSVANSTVHLPVDLRDYLPEWVLFGFCASTGSYYEQNTVRSWQFNSSSIDAPTAPAPAPAPPQAPEQKSGKNTNTMGLVLGWTVGLCVLAGGLFFLGVGLIRKNSRVKSEEDKFGIDMSMDDASVSGTGQQKFSYVQLSSATNNFSDEQKLGEGGFGGVYRGFLTELNSHVAVKRISKGSKQGKKEYATEVRIISRLRHENLVQLIGWCHEKRELLLVYEFMENGSLDFHLFNGKSTLGWATRYKIAEGLALALLYLHEEWEQCVVHRDVKSSNIMLDSNFNAKLGDFGLARCVDHEKVLQTTVLAGTMGYLAPEYIVTGKAGKESDVYSFGIVALEIACGRQTFVLAGPENQMRLVLWVWDLYGKGKLLEAADPKLSTDFDEQQMERLMVVGLWCAHPDQNLRPSIRHAIQVLNFEAPLPVLPAKLPDLSFSSLPKITDLFDSSQTQRFSSSYLTRIPSKVTSLASAASSSSSPSSPSSPLHPEVG